MTEKHSQQYYPQETSWEQQHNEPFAGEKRTKNAFEMLERGLEQSNATELLSGRLPAEQDKELGEDYDYILATNQSGIETIEQLSEYLQKHGGVHTNWHDDRGEALGNRFYIPGYLRKKRDGTMFFNVSRNSMLQHLSSGYEGTMDSFRFVIAIPFSVKNKHQYSALEYQASLDADGHTLARRLLEERMVPDDFLLKGRSKELPSQYIVNKKYIAGIVDNEGTYIQNANFGIK